MSDVDRMNAPAQFAPSSQANREFGGLVSMRRFRCEERSRGRGTRNTVFEIMACAAEIGVDGATTSQTVLALSNRTPHLFQEHVAGQGDDGTSIGRPIYDTWRAT